MKTKRMLSIILAALMVLSAVSVSFVAFGAEDTALQKLKEEILSAQALSDDLATRFKALSDTEKDELGVECIIKVYGWAYDAASGSVQEKTAASQEKLGAYTQNMQKAIEVSKQFNFNYGCFTVKNAAGQDTPAPLHPQFSFTGDYTWYPVGSVGITGGPYVITPDMQNQVMETAFTTYNAQDDIVKEYMLAVSDNMVFDGKTTVANAAQRLAYMNANRGKLGMELDFDKVKPVEPIPQWYSEFSEKHSFVKSNVGWASFMGWDFVINAVNGEISRPGHQREN